MLCHSIYSVDPRQLVAYVQEEDADETRAEIFCGPDGSDVPADALIRAAQFDHFGDLPTQQFDLVVQILGRLLTQPTQFCFVDCLLLEIESNCQKMISRYE